MIHWLAVPLFFYVALTLRKRAAWEKAIALAAFLSYLFLLAKGRDYSRYMVTLPPLLIAAVLYYSWEWIESKGRWSRRAFFLALAGLIAYNFFPLPDSFRFFLKYKVAATEDRFPRDMLQFIDQIPDLDSESSILVLSERQLFFYHTQKKGLDFRDPKMEIFYREGNKDKALDILKNQLKVKYIYVHWETTPSQTLQDILAKDCDLVRQDTINGFALSRLREKPMSKEDLEKYFPNDSLLKNGSFEVWNRGLDKTPAEFQGGDHILDGMVTREEREVKVGRYAAKISGDNFNFAQNLADPEKLRGKTITGFVWMKTDIPNKYRVQIGDGKNSSFSDRHSGSARWELLQVNHVVDSADRSVTVRVVQAEKTGRLDDVVLVDGALVVEGDWNTFYLYSRRDRVK